MNKPENYIEERERIGKRIMTIRQQLGITQTELAARCGLAQSHIARIEAGRYSVGFDTLQQIAEAMDCKIDIIAL